VDNLTAIFRDLFDMPNLNIDGLSRSNFPAWDSLAHVKLILAIEDEYGVRFTTDQVANVSTVEELQHILSSAGRP
jgi:acyl carrier protein